MYKKLWNQSSRSFSLAAKCKGYKVTLVFDTTGYDCNVSDYIMERVPSAIDIFLWVKTIFFCLTSSSLRVALAKSTRHHLQKQSFYYSQTLSTRNQINLTKTTLFNLSSVPKITTLVFFFGWKLTLNSRLRGETKVGT